MHCRYYSTKLQVFQEYLAPRRGLVLIKVGTENVIQNKAGHHLVSKNTGISPMANIRSLAAYERARRALRGVCEPKPTKPRLGVLCSMSVRSTEKEKAGHKMVSRTVGNLACGEYTHTCRLRASSTRSARRMRTQRKRAMRYAPGEIPRTDRQNKTGHQMVSCLFW